MTWRERPPTPTWLHVGDDLVGRKAGADVGAEQLEIRALREADLELGPAIFRGGVEHEDPRLRALLERDLDAAHQHVLVARQPDFLEALARPDGERQRLGELLPDRPQRVEVGVAPFLLAMRWEGRGHSPLPSREREGPAAKPWER